VNRRRLQEKLSALPQGGRILDAGCGEGNNSRFIHGKRPDLQFHGVDIDPASKDKVPEYVRFDVGSVERLEQYEDGFFDCIVCFHVLEHLQDPVEAVREFRRLLKAGGLVVAECPHWISTITPVGFNFYDDPTHVRPFSREGFRTLFRDFNILHAAAETPVYFHLADLYGLKRNSPGYIARRMLDLLNIYRTAVFLMARK
jgi:ubiquinone/menaquinone biosynthesis C-methylase UbiE